MKEMKRILATLVFVFALVMAFQVSPKADPAVTMTDCTKTTVTIKWNPPAQNVTKYTIKRSDGSVIGSVGAATTSVTIENYPEDYTATVRVYYDYTSGGRTYTDYYLGYTYINTKPTKISKDNFGIDNIYSSSKKMDFLIARGNIDYRTEFKIYKYSSGDYKAVKTMSDKGSYSDTFEYSQNQIYRYKVRQYYVNSTNGKTYYSDWSDYRYFDCAGITYKTKSTKKGLYCTFKKVSGVKDYTIYVAKSKDGTYKKTKTVKNAKTTYHLTKIGKDTMKKGKTYYVKVVPNLKKGKSDTFSTTNFYCYK